MGSFLVVSRFAFAIAGLSALIYGALHYFDRRGDGDEDESEGFEMGEGWREVRGDEECGRGGGKGSGRKRSGGMKGGYGTF
ncbi:hypothetical protein BKA61DRAFT_592889 [Leptodontidium sp. MPI-SDFR-AT-0119]|nr:hypothetical protein BKA61DRAFT_592889 [Leptodontidium sp. MPI-SDFR-AT-0119]